jgi:SAM-dependent methyltransferase
VLDIGCGTGALSVDAARAVGPDGRVLATDIAAPLLARAAERLAAFRQAQTMEADAQHADWPGAKFDHAISRLGVMFFSDPPHAFANIARALRSGGRMTFASWAPARVNPFWSDTSRLAAEVVGHPPKILQDTPGPMGLADVDLTTTRLREAGLSGVSVEPVDIRLLFDEGANRFPDLALKIGPAARVARYSEASESQMDEIRQAIATWASQFEVGGVLRIPAVINLIEATRP